MVILHQCSSSLIHTLPKRKKLRRRKRKKKRRKLRVKRRNTRRKRRRRIRTTLETCPSGNLTGHPSSQIWGLMRAILIAVVKRSLFIKISILMSKSIIIILHPRKAHTIRRSQKNMKNLIIQKKRHIIAKKKKLKNVRRKKRRIIAETDFNFGISLQKMTILII